MNQFLLTKKAYSIGLYYHLEKKGKRIHFGNHSLPARDLQSCTRIYSLVHLLSLSLPVQCNIYVYRLWRQSSRWNWCIIVFFPSDLFLFSNQFGRLIDVLFFRKWSRESFNCHDAVPYTTKTIASKVHWVDHFYLVPFTGRSSIYCFG